MNLDDLKRVLPPPQDPPEADEAILAANERSLGVKFPADFVEFSRVYGSGSVWAGGKIWQIYSAFYPNYRAMVDDFVQQKSAYREAGLADDVTYELFPAPGGLLPFGQIDALYFAWKTQGAPEDWTIVFVDYFTADGVWEYSCGFTEIMVFLLNDGYWKNTSSEPAMFNPGLRHWYGDDRAS